MSTTDIEARYLKQITKLAVTETLESLGLIKGQLSTNECRKMYGTWFSDAVRRGDLRGISVGNKIVYSREDIEARLAAELKQAKVQLRKVGVN